MTVLERDDASVTLRVDDVAAGGGEVVFSRLAWPGYSTSGGSLADPEREFLLTVAVEPEDVGTSIVVTFRPPGWTVEILSAIIALLIAAAWTAVWALVRRSSRATRPGSSWTVD